MVGKKQQKTVFEKKICWIDVVFRLWTVTSSLKASGFCLRTFTHVVFSPKTLFLQSAAPFTLGNSYSSFRLQRNLP